MVSLMMSFKSRFFQAYVHISGAKWLAKDLIFVLARRDNAEQALDRWLTFHMTQHCSTTLNRHITARDLNNPAGTIQAALHFDLKPHQIFQRLGVSIIGSRGQLPNLDLFNTIVRWATYQALPDAIALEPSPEFESLFTQMLTSYPSNLLVSSREAEILSHLFMFAGKQALGVPSGPHAIYLK